MSRPSAPRAEAAPVSIPPPQVEERGATGTTEEVHEFDPHEDVDRPLAAVPETEADSLPEESEVGTSTGGGREEEEDDEPLPDWYDQALLDEVRRLLVQM